MSALLESGGVEQGSVGETPLVLPDFGIADPDQPASAVPEMPSKQSAPEQKPQEPETTEPAWDSNKKPDFGIADLKPGQRIS